MNQSNTIQKVTSANAHEDQAWRFIAEASSLGLPPGQFPGTLSTDLGNGQPFVLAGYDPHFEVHVYRQALGCISLHVLND